MQLSGVAKLSVTWTACRTVYIVLNWTKRRQTNVRLGSFVVLLSRVTPVTALLKRHGIMCSWWGNCGHR